MRSIVELEEGGFRGFGEAGGNAYYRTSVAEMVALLERHRAAVEARSIDDPALIWEEFRPWLGSCRFAQCALDTACHDLWGKVRQAPVWKLWGLSLDKLPPTDYTIGIDTIDRMVAKLQEFAGWPVYKIKLGTPARPGDRPHPAPAYRCRVPGGRQLWLERRPVDRQLVGARRNWAWN